jgi:hypothetical protein
MWRNPWPEVEEALGVLPASSSTTGGASVSPRRFGGNLCAPEGRGTGASVTLLSMVARPFRATTTSMLPAAVAAGTRTNSSVADTLTVLGPPLTKEGTQGRPERIPDLWVRG